MKRKKLFIEIPCEIGTTVYIVGCKYRSGRLEKWINTGKFRILDLEKLGKTVFLTKEDAEQKIKDME